MAVAIYKTFVAGEVLTAADLNASLLQILNNGDDLASPATKAHDMNGFGLVMDADADSNLRASVDDRLDLTLGGVSLFRWDGTVALPITGLDFIAGATGVAPRITATGSDTNISINLVPKGTGVLLINGAPLGENASDLLSHRIFL